jgi:uncharacterized membrane protein YhaH (DUF805 family)
MIADPQAPEYNDAADRSARSRARRPIPASRARAGVTGHDVRYVLAFSVIAAVAAFLIVYLIYVRRLIDRRQSLRSVNACLALPTSAAKTGGAALPQALRI